MAERNALAELAERMRNRYDNQTSWWQDDKEGKDFDKAQRILAVLAEAYRLNDYGVIRLSHNVSLYDVVYKCRAIAEEGADNDK